MGSMYKKADQVTGASLGNAEEIARQDDEGEEVGRPGLFASADAQRGAAQMKIAMGKMGVQS